MKATEVGRGVALRTYARSRQGVLGIAGVLVQGVFFELMKEFKTGMLA